MKAIKNFRAAEEYIGTFFNLERNLASGATRAYRLDRMRRLLDLFEHPENSFQCIHIAGSKGKGSTAAMIASVLTAAGFTTGLYTSPHVRDIRERIMINQKMVGRAVFTRALEAIRSTTEKRITQKAGAVPTFFEILTLLAFLIFRQAGCRYAVVETGLGGRLDATNTVLPLASILTPIEPEHEEILGDTLEKIAAEKCGIIKPGVPVFSSRQDLVVRDVIIKTASHKRSPVIFADQSLTSIEIKGSLEKSTIRLKSENSPVFSCSLGLPGAFQAENAGLVYLVLKQIFPFVPEKAIKRGFSAVRLPGRIEIVSRKPLLIADGAHTPGSIKRVAELIQEHTTAPRVLIFGAVAGKKYREMAQILAPLFERIIVTSTGLFKKSAPEEVFAAFRLLRPDSCFKPDIEVALHSALAHAQKQITILVTGSFYLVGEIKKLMGK